MNVERVTSLDGTSIAFERTGRGPALVLVGGAFCDRNAAASGTPLAVHLAHRFTVFSYDRRARGDSAGTAPCDVEREREDLAAVLDAAGGDAAVFGNSSGALLALDVAARERAVARVVCFEPPLLLDASRVASFMSLAETLDALVHAGERGEAVERFLTEVVQMPREVVARMRGGPMWPGLQRIAHTLSNDVRLTARGPARLDEARRVTAATWILSGSASPAWMREAATRLAAALSHGRHVTLDGQTHAVETPALAEAIAAVLAP